MTQLSQAQTSQAQTPQAHQPYKMFLPPNLAQGVLLLHHLTCSEDLSEVGLIELELLSLRADLKADDLLGQAATFSLELPSLRLTEQAQHTQPTQPERFLQAYFTQKRRMRILRCLLTVFVGVGETAV
jgi:uncharacterized protein involved in type VI secretion and phage assembly